MCTLRRHIGGRGKEEQERSEFWSVDNSDPIIYEMGNDLVIISAAQMKYFGNHCR